MPPAGLEPAIPASEWPQTYNSDRAATGIGQKNYHLHYFDSSIIFLTTEPLFFPTLFNQNLPLPYY